MFGSRLQSLLRTFFCLGVAWLAITTNTQAAETVRVGYYDKKPVIFRTEDSRPQGLIVDILADIARENDWELTYVHGSFPEGLGRLMAGEIDLMLPIGYTEARDARIDYIGEALLETWSYLFTQRDGPIHSIQDVEGKRIAYLKGSLFEEEFRKLTDVLKLTYDFIEVADYNELFAGVAQGRFDGGVGERLAIVGLVPELARHIEKPFVFHPFSQYAAAAEGDPKGLLAPITRYLARGKVDLNSTYTKYKNYWFSGVPDSAPPLSLALIIVFFFLIFFTFLVYVFLRISLVRNALGLNEVVQAQVSSNLLIAAGLLAVFTWLAVCLAEYLWFERGTAFEVILMPLHNPHEIFMRLLIAATVLLGGIGASRVLVRLAAQHRLTRENEEHLRTTLDSIGDAVIVTDTSGRIARMNTIAENLTGWTVGETNGKPLADVFNIVNAQTGEKVENSVRRVLEKETIVGLEGHTMLISKDGTKYQIDDSAAPIRDDGGRITGVVLVFRDVTEDYRMRENLRQSEERLNLALFGANDGIWDWYLESDTVHFDARYYTMAGYDSNEFPGAFEEWEKRVHPDDIRQSKAAVNQYLAGERETFEVEFRFLRKDGDYMWIRGKGKIVARDEKGNPARFIGTHSDITDLKLTEKALRESEERYRTLFENMSIVCFTFDRQGRFLSWNLAAEQVYGYTKQEAIGASCYDLIVTSQTKEATDDVINRVFQGDFIVGSEWQDHNKKGEIGWRMGNAFPLLNTNGTVVCGVNLNIDITERKRAEEALRQFNQELEARVLKRTAELESAKEAAEVANQAKSAFLTNMSHELRTPLNVILGFSSLMRREALSGQADHSDEQRDSLEYIHRSGEHLLVLINNILDLSKIEAGRVSVEQSEFELYTLIMELRDMFSLKAQKKYLRLEAQMSAQVPHYVRSDDVKLRQVLINMIGNAIKFTDSGTITVRVKRISPADSKTTQSGDCRLRFEIEDTGPGLSAAEMESLFQPFSQTTVGQAAQEGTGLGLAISRKYVQLMGGDIEVQSLTGQGTTFSFEISVTEVEPFEPLGDSTQHSVVALAQDQPHPRILVVDDQQSNRQLISRLLCLLGLEVREAANGREAIEVWQDWQPHLIWMDIRMPVMDGKEATRRIRAMPGGDKVKIVALTASAFEEQRMQILAAGGDALVRKPHRESEIYETMGRLLGLRYLYADSTTREISRDGEVANLTKECLSGLPAELRSELKSTVAMLEPIAIQQIIEKVRTANAATAEKITFLASDFRYGEILRLLDE